MPRRSKRDRVYHHHLRRLCVSLVGRVMTSAARGARDPRISNGEAFFLHGVGPSLGARVRGRGAIPSRDALPPSVHLLSLPAIYTGGDGCDPAEEHEVVLSLPLASWRTGASVSCEIGGERLECRAISAARERGRIVATVAVRPPPGTEGVAFFEPAGVAPPRGYDSVIAAPVIFCAERAVCAAVNRAFYSAEAAAARSSDVPDRLAAYHRDDAIVALGAALVEPERRPVDPAAAAILRRWGVADVVVVVGSSASPPARGAMIPRLRTTTGAPPTARGDPPPRTTTPPAATPYRPSTRSRRGSCATFPSRRERTPPPRARRGANRSGVVDEGGAGRRSAARGRIGAQHAVSHDDDDDARTRGCRPGASADRLGLAAIPVVDPATGEPETALHVAATLDDAAVACALLADPIAAMPYMWSTYRRPGGGGPGGGGRVAPAEAAATRARNRRFRAAAVRERHPVDARGEGAHGRRGARGEAVEARGCALGPERVHRGARGRGAAAASRLRRSASRPARLIRESDDDDDDDARRLRSFGSSLGSIQRDHERDAVVFAKLDDPNGVSHLVDTFVRGKRDPSVDAALDARLRQMRHEARGSWRSGLRSRTGGAKRGTSLKAAPNPSLPGGPGFWTMTKRWLACCVPDGETSSLAPDFWSPTPEDRSRSFAFNNANERDHHDHHQSRREDSDETAIRRRLGTLAASPAADAALAVLTIAAEGFAVLRTNSWRPARALSHYGAAIAAPSSGTAVLLSHLVLLALVTWAVIHVFVLGNRRGTWYRRRETFVCLFRVVNPIAMRLMVNSAATAARAPLFLCDPWWGAKMHMATMVGAEIFRVRYERLVVVEVAQAIVSGMYDHISPRSLCVAPTAAIERDLLTVFRVVGLVVPLVMWTYAREQKFRRFPKVWDKVMKKMV